MERAVNPTTGEVVFLVGNEWIKPAETARNPDGDTAYLVKNQWQVVKAAPEAVKKRPSLGSAMGEDVGSSIMGAAQMAQPARREPEAVAPKSAVTQSGSINAQDYLAAVAKRKEENPDRSVSDLAVDSGVTFLKAAIGLPEAFVGLADIPTTGRIGKFLEERGYKPKEAKVILDTYLSEAQQAANRKVSEAKGFGPTLAAGLQNPSVIATSAAESLPQMVGGAGLARGLMKAAPAVAPWMAGAIGEGVLGAGSAAEQMREESKTGLLTPKQSLSALGSGAGTAAFGAVAGRLASKLGLDDVETMLAAGSTNAKSKSLTDFAKRAGASGVSEGVFEELPQSAQERMWMNYATDKPIMDGVAEASAMGLLTGAAMGMAGTGAGQILGKKGQELPSAEQMMRDRGFLVTEQKAQPPVPPAVPSTAPEAEPAIPAPAAPTELSQQREKEQKQVLDLEQELEAPAPAAEVAPPVAAQPEIDYSSKSFEELQDLRNNADQTNHAMDMAAIEKHLGAEAAAQYDSMNRRQRNKWWEQNATDALDRDSSTFNGVNEETIDEYIKAYNNFDTESPRALGRSVGLLARDLNSPKFIGSPDFVRLKNALAYANEQGWSEAEVLGGMRERAGEWAGADAQELFKDLFKPKAAAAPKAGLTLAKEDNIPLTEEEPVTPFAREDLTNEPMPNRPEVQTLLDQQEAANKAAEELSKRTAGTSLIKVLQGSLKDSEMSELGGRSRQIGKNPFISLVAKKGAPGSSMEDMVNGGSLNEFLPYRMRPNTETYDNAESAEYIRDKLRQGQYYTYETQLALEDVNRDIWDLDKLIQEELSLDDINKEIQRAFDEQREADLAAEAAPTKGEAGGVEPSPAAKTDDELDKREAQLEREAQLNEREAKLLEERKRLEEERLKLESPTKEEVVQEEERKAKAAELDEREQVRKESEAGAGQFELTREEGRQDTTGNLFEQPTAEPETVEVSPEQERKEALENFGKQLLVPIPPFRAKSAKKIQLLKPTPLTKALVKEVSQIASDALDLGLPAAVLGNVTAAGSTRLDARAVMSGSGWLMLAKHWKLSSPAEKLQAFVHELGHAVDFESSMVSGSPSWAKAHAELKNWYDSSANKVRHPLGYPFAPQFKGQTHPEQESFAQAFSYYFTSPVDLQKNAPEAYSQIQAIVERIQDGSQKARAAGTAATGTAGIKIQPARTTEGAAVQPNAGEVGTAISAAQGLEDRSAVTENPAFKRWSYGLPIYDSLEDNPSDRGVYRVYHATRADFKEFIPGGLNPKDSGPATWLSPYADYQAAIFRTGSAATGFREGTNVMPLYARVASPLVIDDKAMLKWAQEVYGDREFPQLLSQKTVDLLKSDGYDSILFKGEQLGWGEHADEIIVFSPNQIKSAIGNNGEYGLETQNINAMAGATIFGQKPLVNWTAPEFTDKDKFIYAIQNRHIDTKRVVDEIAKSIGTIDDRWNPYLMEELFHGRAAKQTKDFLVNELRPLLKEMDRLGITIPELEEYLHNKHAEERNKQVAKVNPTMPDGGSGIDTADARAYLAALTPEQKKNFDQVNRMVKVITGNTRQMLVDSGLESQDTIDAWEKTYGEYVPLNRDDVDYSSNQGQSAGQGFSVRGASSKRAVGSTRKVVDILANIAMQRERTIVRAEKNRVATALYGLALKNPNPKFWIAVNPDSKKDMQATINELVNMGLTAQDALNLMKEPTQTVVDPQTGLVTQRVNPVLRGANNVMAIRVNGKDRFVFFNQNNERANRMVTALKNLDADQLGWVMSNMAKGTRYFASINTQYNPVFGVYNFLRDMEGATLQLTNTALAGKQKEVMKNVMPAVAGIYSQLRADHKGKVSTGQWSKLWEEFQQQGGQTGFRDQFSRAEERSQALERELKKMSQGKANQAKDKIFDWLSDYNETMENAVRLAAYKAGLDNGLSKEKAASLAKNLTVNFNRKGQISTQAGALYAFFNSAVQGTTRLGETLTGPAGKTILAGGFILGSMQAALLAGMGFGDDDPPDFVKDKNFIIPLMNGKYLAIPMPLGYNVIPSTARILAEGAIDFAQGKKVNAPKRLEHIMGLLLDAFNPVGNAGWSAQTFTPTLGDPIVALLENKDWTGKPIAKQDFNKLDPTPGYMRAKETASIFGKKISEFINYASGGTKDVPGIVSPTPDQIDYLIGQATGGLGREALKASSTIQAIKSGEELPPHKIPLIGRFYGDIKGSSSVANHFYENIKKMNEYENTVKGMRERRENVQQLYKENPEARAYQFANEVEREVQKLRKLRHAQVEKGAPKETVQSTEKRITSQMKRLNDRIESLEKKRSRSED